MKKRPIIIDTDPGIDDAIAIAIALASEKLDVKLFTTVVGNVSLKKVTNNILKLLTFWNKKIPVAKGAVEPLIEKLQDASNVHGASGMDGYDFEEINYDNLLKEHAVIAMRDVILKSKEKITLVPIGPLTNIALLFKMYPEVKENIEEIVLMGGGFTGRGNRGVLGEFNIAFDPEAAKIVFESKLPIIMAPLEAGWKALLYPEDSIKIKNLGKTGEMLYSILQKYRGIGLKNGLKMYDACAICYLINPEIFQTIETHVEIETTSALTRGVTLVDEKNLLKLEKNAKVIVDVNQEMFKDVLLENLAKYK